MEATTEIQELSLEKVIESKLVQNNVTKMVIAALKKKYGGLRLKSVEDKESYLEIKVAAREVAKIRTLVVNICKKGREDAVKTQKAWIAKEKEVVSELGEVENPLDAEIELFDNEVKRLADKEKKRQEEAYINRQAVLTKLGGTYIDGSFVLGEASFDAVLVKASSQNVWEDAIVPKFQAEYEKIEAVRLAAEIERTNREVAFKAEQEKMRQEQEAFRLQQEKFAKEQAEVARIEKERLQVEQAEQLKIQRENEYESMKVQAAEAAEAKRLADIEIAIQKEKERQEREVMLAEQAKIQAEEKRKAELEAAGDRIKWESFIKKVSEIETFEMRSGQYRKRMQVAKEKIEEILSL